MSNKEYIVNVADNAQLETRNEIVKNTEPEIDDPQFLCSLRNLIYKIFTVDKEIPTLPKLLIEAKNLLNFNGSKSLLRKILKAKLGFKYRYCRNNGPIPMERHKVALVRFEYLSDLARNDSLGPDKKPVIYVDETLVYLDEHSQDANNVWCIMLAGGDNGFLDKATFVYKCVPKKKAHNLIGKKKFLKWLRQKLLPNLPANSIVVIDDAPQHNEIMEEVPDYHSTKEDIIDWLQQRNIEFSNDNIFDELLQIVRKNLPKNDFVVDDTLTLAGHCVLRLPLYCNLSPMDSIWSLIKKQVAQKQTADPQAEFDKIIGEAIATVTKEDWKQEMEIVKKLEEEYEKNELRLDKAIDRLNLSIEMSESEMYLSSSSDEDYDTDFSATDDSDENSYSSNSSYMSLGPEHLSDYEASDGSDKLDSYKL